MPRPRTDEYWRELAKTKFAQNEGVTVAQVRRELEAHAEKMEKSDDPKVRAMASTLPSERTIARIRAEEWATLGEPERAQYREFFWPESMERGDLPWEASESALELLFFLDQHDFRTRPPVRFVTWYWRVSMAVPDALVYLRAQAAMWFAVNEAGYELDSPRPDEVRGMEWYLVYLSEQREERRELYREALTRCDSPLQAAPRYMSLDEGRSVFASETPHWMGLIHSFFWDRFWELRSEA